MDMASLVGLVLAVLLMLGAMVLGGSPLVIFFDLPSMLVVFGGALAAVLISFPLRSCLKMPRVLAKCFFNRPPDYPGLVWRLVSLAETARREGLLALEDRLEELTDPFLRLGVQLAIDGTRPEVLEDVLKTEMTLCAARHRDGKNTLDQLGRYTPAFGMIGTLLGLVMMLNNLSDPSSIGAGMAVALLTTLYGVVAANACFLPCAEKLAGLHRQEMMGREMVLRGVLAIQSGEHPRVVEQKLLAFLAPRQRLRRSPEVFEVRKAA